MNDLIRHMCWKISDEFGLHVHPDELLHDFEGELDRDVNELEFVEAGA